jgi:hypothetical protein
MMGEGLGVLGLMLAVIGIVWAILGFLIPFMIWSIMSSCKQIERELQALRGEQQRHAKRLLGTIEDESENLRAEERVQFATLFEIMEGE